jgi:CheY-like chemotaxis protein
VILSLVTLSVGIAYAVLFTLFRKGRIAGYRLGRGLVTSIIAVYSVIQMVFNTFNVLTIQGEIGMIILVMLIGLVPVIPFRKSGTLILAALVYTLALMYAARDIKDDDGLSSWDHFVQTDLRANLLIMVGLTAFVSAIVYNLYVKNFLKSVALEEANRSLEESNDSLEEQVRERTAQLEEQKALAQSASNVKSRFLSAMNHEFRTPLNAIVGMAGMTGAEVGAQKRREAIAEIERQSARLISILDDMSDIMADEKRIIPDEAAPGVPDLAGRRVLVVDDVEINRTVLAGLIEITSAEVAEAADGGDAVELFAASPEGYYSLVFMDIMMPSMDGYEATRRIRASGRADAAVPIIAISANALSPDVDSSIAAGMNSHIAKPVDFDTVMRILKEYL